jgi:tRNA(fMet)-specific endonuclease VapC
MAVAYLLDTNTVSYIIKGRPPRVRERLLEVPIQQVGISVVTEAELRFGVARMPQESRLEVVVEEFLRRIEILAWDSRAAAHYANVRATLERTGQPIGNLDLMIAAQALAIGAILVSSDRVFRKVKGLVIQDWITSQ